MTSPEYQRLQRWISSRIGADPADPSAQAKLDGLIASERARFPSAKGRMTFTSSGSDTIVSGGTMPFRGRLRRLGGTWERRLKAWVVKGKKVSEADVQEPSEMAGLLAYVSRIPYRKNLGR